MPVSPVVLRPGQGTAPASLSHAKQKPNPALDALKRQEELREIAHSMSDVFERAPLAPTSTRLQLQDLKVGQGLALLQKLPPNETVLRVPAPGGKIQNLKAADLSTLLQALQAAMGKKADSLTVTQALSLIAEQTMATKRQT